MQPSPHAAITTAINSALLAAADPSIGTFTVVVRLLPDEAEIEVLADTATAEGAQRAVASLQDTAPGGASFADWLSATLRRQGLSQEAAARQLGVSVRTVSRWVRGQTEPRLRDVRRINETFGPLPHS